MLVGWMVLAFGFPAVTKVTWIALYFIRVASLLLAPGFPCASGGRSAGRELDGVIQQIRPTRFPRRWPWIVPEFRPRDLFADDSDLFVDK